MRLCGGSWLQALAGSGGPSLTFCRAVSPALCGIKANVLPASRVSIVHPRDRRPASERSVLSPHRKSLWTDLITACGLKTAPFNSHTRVFFQAFTQTHTGRGPFPKPAFVDKSYSVRARDGRCVHSLGAAVSSMRHGVCQTRAGETGEREGGRNTREREINIAQWLNI